MQEDGALTQEAPAPVAGAPFAYGGHVDGTVAAIRTMIAGGVLVPGQHLRQDDIAARLGTTRGPVREAFQSLIAEGVLQHIPNRGHFVAQLSSDELGQLYWIREQLEDEVIRTTVWPDPTGLAKISKLADAVHRFTSAERPYDFAEVTRADRRFHFALWALSPLGVLRRELERVWRRTEPYHLFMPLGNPELVARSVQEHDAILSAIADRDRGRYAELLTAHRQSALRTVGALRAEEEAREQRQSGVG